MEKIEDMDNNENRAVPITVSVPYNMAKWLDEHKNEFSRSKIFQDAVRRLQNMQQQHFSPFLHLSMTMAFTFGIALLLVSTTNVFEPITSLMLMILGVFVIANSVMILYREVRRNARRNR